MNMNMLVPKATISDGTGNWHMACVWCHCLFYFYFIFHFIHITNI